MGMSIISKVDKCIKTSETQSAKITKENNDQIKQWTIREIFLY